MKRKFTKGEWKYRDAIGKNYYYIETVDQTHQNTFIGEVGGGLQSSAEIKANAKLIAAAPDLFESLEECVIAMKKVCSSAITPFIERAEKAIKKATDI